MEPGKDEGKSAKADGQEVKRTIFFFPQLRKNQVAQIKNLPADAEDTETQVQSLGQEDPLEEEMATQSSILAWEIPWTEGPGGL